MGGPNLDTLKGLVIQALNETHSLDEPAAVRVLYRVIAAGEDSRCDDCAKSFRTCTAHAARAIFAWLTTGDEK